jgi:hypothetical protein
VVAPPVDARSRRRRGVCRGDRVVLRPERGRHRRLQLPGRRTQAVLQRAGESTAARRWIPVRFTRGHMGGARPARRHQRARRGQRAASIGDRFFQARSRSSRGLFHAIDSPHGAC